MDKIEISSVDNLKSEIFIQNGLSDKIQDFFENKKYFLITNKTIAKLYPCFVQKFDKDKIIIINDGEKYKNIKTFNYIVENLLKRKIERKDAIVALGGGVVGDLAGYVASSVLRGVELIQVPTTLLAMCDSAIGGKTGFNSKYGKNLIGSFYLAKKIIIDPNFLNTLNDYQYKCGLGEILKYAFIEKSCKCDTKFELIDFLLKNEPLDIKNNMNFLVKASASLKASVVNLDRLEGGLRKILNFGHTFAHPIETLSHYRNISHGAAVALGIKYASQLAYNLKKIDENYYNKINFLINKFDLVKKEPKFPKSKIINLMFQDKKVIDGKINLLLPFAEGQVELVDNIDLLSIEASLP